MKVVFFQPYLAAWRIEFLERFIAETDFNVVIFDGGFKSKKNDKATSGNETNCSPTRLWNFPFVFKIARQVYPLYFSPALIIHLFKERPDKIVTEGEINLLNIISIYFYCLVTGSKYLWWSLGKVRTRKETIANKIFGKVMGFLIANANVIITKNSLARNYYIEKYQIPKDRVILAPNSMDEKKALSEVDSNKVQDLRKQKTGNVVLYSGALTPEKRPADLIWAFSDLVRKNQEQATSQLWFIGDGPESDHLKQLAESLPCSDQIIFWGRVTKGVGSYFSVADVVVVPGLGGLAINHAMIFGCPVISRLADGTEHDLIINGETGWILNDYDNQKLSQKIGDVLNANKSGKMSQNAINLINEKWNMDIMIERFVTALRSKNQ